jgi:hypothetical protein
MSDTSPAPPPDEVPEGAAVFPAIPAELGVDPLLLAALHAVVFLAGSDESVVHPAAADEALQAVAGYLQRLRGESLRRVREDMECLATFARQERWPKQLARTVKSLLLDMGVGTEEGQA